jgi:hypothetical protein
MTQFGATVSGTTIMPLDDTTPQNTERHQVMTVNFTPKRADSKLKISVNTYVSHGSKAASMGVALFRDTTVDAIGAGLVSLSASGYVGNIKLDVIVPSNSTALTTFNVRIGASVAGTTSLNTNTFGNTSNSYIEVSELVGLP